MKGRRTKLCFDLSNLSKTEKRYFNIMLVGKPLYIRGVPGNAKSAIARSICRKVIWWYPETPNEKHNGMNFIDLRLADKDETDLGSYPVTRNPIDQILKFGEMLDKGWINLEEFNKVKQKYLDVVLESDDVTSLSFAVPDWAIRANSYPTLIAVEELNRCDPKVRAASLQLLNENQIGSFQFNENVFWMASGNLGDKDRTEVDELDLAISNRMCILDHDLPTKEWAANFGWAYCWEPLVDYLMANPTLLYIKPASDEIRYATARSWTNLSDYIFSTFGENPDLKEVAESEETSIVGLGWIGSGYRDFQRYLKETSRIGIIDIMNRWDEVKDEIKKLGRGRTMELMSGLRGCTPTGSYIFFADKNKSQCENIVNFLKVLSPDKIDKTTKEHSNDDEVTSYILFLVDKMEPANEKFHKWVIKFFPEKAALIHKWVNNGRHKKNDGTPDFEK